MPVLPQSTVRIQVGLLSRISAGGRNLPRDAAVARRSSRGTGRGTNGCEFPVQLALEAQSAVMFVQVADLRHARVPLVMRRSSVRFR